MLLCKPLTSLRGDLKLLLQLSALLILQNGFRIRWLALVEEATAMQIFPKIQSVIELCRNIACIFVFADNIGNQTGHGMVGHVTAYDVRPLNQRDLDVSRKYAKLTL